MRRGRCLSLADFTGAQIDKEVATQAKKILVLDRPYMKKSAWVGTESLPHVFYENFKSFSQRELPTFSHARRGDGLAGGGVVSDFGCF